MENRILTTHNYIRKGGNGPNIFILGGPNAKSFIHLMIHFHFAQGMWGALKKVFYFVIGWNSQDLNLCVKEWFDKVECWNELLVICCWELWIHINYVLVEEKPKYAYKVVSNIISQLKDWHQDKDQGRYRYISPPFIYNSIHVGILMGLERLMD